jgi:hypothetical protein
MTALISQLHLSFHLSTPFYLVGGSFQTPEFPFHSLHCPNCLVQENLITSREFLPSHCFCWFNLCFLISYKEVGMEVGNVLKPSYIIFCKKRPDIFIGKSILELCDWKGPKRSAHLSSHLWAVLYWKNIPQM